jgi:hypothetical protein
MSYVHIEDPKWIEKISQSVILCQRYSLDALTTTMIIQLR